MPFDEYMEMCLYDPDEGFFAAGPLRSGKKGNFVTSPEISWAFGHCIGEWVDNNIPSAHAALIEVGPGSGNLLREVIAPWSDSGDPVYAVERSDASRAFHEKRFPDATVVASLGEIPVGTDAVIIANEVLDNMAAALACRTKDGWVEVAVGVEGDDLMLVEIAARREVAEWCEDVFGAAPAGVTVSVQLAVSDWIAGVFDHFGKVTMCLIDYGGRSDELIARDPRPVVRTYRKHQSGFDWLQHPAETDITVDVNVTGVLKAIARAGHKASLISQRDFVLEQGLDELIAETRDDEQLAASKGAIMHQLENRSERLDMEALIDPNGLGAFKVILVE